MLRLLLWREWLNYRRNPMKFFGMIGNALIMVIIVGVFFLSTVPLGSEIQTLAEQADALSFMLVVSK